MCSMYSSCIHDEYNPSEVSMKPQLTGSSQNVYEYVKRRIITGEYEPGQFLTELQLSHETNLSRTPVRECLQVLHNEGWIRLTPRKGATVSDLSPQDIQDLFDLRRCLERFAVAEILSRREPVNCEALESLVEQQIDALRSGDEGLYLEVDRQFHRSLLDLLGNRQFSRVIDNLGDQILRCGFRVTRRDKRQEEAIQEHRAIIAALEARDERGCLEAVERHNTNTLRRILLPTSADTEQ